MSVTDYHSTHKGELATIPYVAHEIVIAKHKRREKMLTVALILSLFIGTLTHLIRSGAVIMMYDKRRTIF